VVWDPFGTLGRALWIGGGQWAGKSTVARLLAHRFGVTAYHLDFHDARAHEDRRVARALREGGPPPERDPDRTWVRTAPEQLAAQALAEFAVRFDWVLDDLRALVSGRPVLAEGWALRPDLVAPLLDAPDRMLVMVPTEEFRLHQVRRLPRAARLDVAGLSDPDLAQRNRLARDRILAADAVRAARRHGVRVVEVDGSLGEAAVADLVADHFAAHLRP
jgi:hypothetical protein